LRVELRQGGGRKARKARTPDQVSAEYRRLDGIDAPFDCPIAIGQNCRHVAQTPRKSEATLPWLPDSDRLECGSDPQRFGIVPGLRSGSVSESGVGIADAIDPE